MVTILQTGTIICYDNEYDSATYDDNVCHTPVADIFEEIQKVQDNHKSETNDEDLLDKDKSVAPSSKRHRVYKNRLQSDKWKEAIMVKSTRKITDQQIKDIRIALINRTKSHQEIGKDFGVSRGQVSKIDNKELLPTDEMTLEHYKSHQGTKQANKDLTKTIIDAGYPQDEVNGIKTALRLRKCIPSEIIDIIAYRMENQNKSNEEVATHFKELLGKKVTKDMVYNITSKKTKLYNFEFPVNSTTFDEYESMFTKAT